MEAQNISELKGKLFDLLWGLEDAQSLAKIKIFAEKTVREVLAQEPDWWDELSEAQQERLNRALEQSYKGETKSHADVMKGVEKRLKRMSNGA